MDIDKKLVQNTELTFLKENLIKTLLLNDDGIVELYEEGKLIDSKPFSKINIERDYKKIIQEGYTLIEDKDELIKFNIYLLCGEDGVYNSRLVDIVDSLEQAQDRVAELQAESGCGAYYEKVDKNGKILEDKEEEVTRGKIKVIDLSKQAKHILDKNDNTRRIVFTDNGFADIEKQGISGYGFWLGYKHNGWASEKNMENLLLELKPEIAKIFVDELNEEGINCTIDDVRVENWINTTDMIRFYLPMKDNKILKEDQNLQQDLDQTEQELQDDIEQVDRAQELKDELEDKLDKLYNESKLEEDQYENERRRGIPPAQRIAEDEVYDNLDWYLQHIDDYIDETDFIDKNIAEIGSEYNLKGDMAKEVCKKIYELAVERCKGKLEETTNKELEQRKQDLHQRERQALKDAGDENWENLLGIAKRLPEDVWQEFYKEEEELRCISMIHSILTYTSKDNWNVEYLLNERYMQSYITELGIEKVKELCEKEVQEYLDNAVVDRDVYTDSEGVSYNTVSFKNENKITESPEQVPGTEVKNIRDIAPEIPNSENITKKLSKQEILNLTTLNLNDKQKEFLKHLEITEQEIIDAFKDLVQQMKHLQYDKPFMSIKEYIDEVLKF